MAHITFVHGIANKPAPDTLLDQWRVALLDDDGPDLDALGVTSSMIYWADMLYPDPLPAGASQESARDVEQTVDPNDAHLGWITDLPDDQRDFVEQLAKDVGLPHTAIEIDTGDAQPTSVLELLPLPKKMEIRLMKLFLRDVHHFMYDATFSPRPDKTFHIRTDIRDRARKILQEGASKSGAHIVVGHSLGSVIAYDALVNIDDAPPVDALLTVGSPLGISEVQDGLTPPWTAADGWPTTRLGDKPWRNVFDPLDPVCGLRDRRIGGDFRRAGRILVDDVEVRNRGTWRHSIAKYLGQGQLRSWLEDLVR